MLWYGGNLSPVICQGIYIYIYNKMGREIILRLLFYATSSFFGLTRVEGLKIAVNAEQHMTIMEGTQNVALNCPIMEASPPVIYRWFHSPAAQPLNETEITVSTRSYKVGKSALTITTVSKRDQGNFRAEIADNAGGSVMCRFNLNVPYPPVFVNLPPSEIYVNMSQAFSFDCIAEGNPTPEITWLKDGAPLGNRNNIRYVGSQIQFTKMETFDRGSYQCNATNQYGNVVSPSTMIYVDVPLVFTSIPQSVLSVNDGENVTIECNITGFPHPIIQWFKDNYMLNNDYHRVITKVYGEFSSWSHLTFTGIKLSDSGLYTCEAQNRNQVITSVSELIVQVLPKVTSHHPEGIIVKIGDPFSLECKASGIPPPTYTWFHNGNPIAIHVDTHFNVDRRSGLLEIQESFGTDAGDYYCHVVNEIGEVNSPTTNVYIEGLHFLKHPPPTVYILRGTSKEFNCAVAGSRRKLSVVWYKDDQILEPVCPAGVKQMSSDCPVEIIGSSLILNRVSVDQEGIYTCVGKETDVVDPQEIRARIDVHIMVEPEFVPELPSVIESTRLEDLILNCTATGKPQPKIEWLKTGMHMSNDTFREVMDGVLHIKELHTRHNGKYTCRATNDAGSIVQVVRIHINSGPATLNVTISVKSWTATVSWEVKMHGSYEIHHFELEYRQISPEITNWVGIGGNIPGEARQYTLTDLNGNTTYQIHMWAINSQGIGEIITKEFTTLPASAHVEGLASNHLIIIVSCVAVVLSLILLVICIILTRKNSNIWIRTKQEDGHALMNNQYETNSHTNPAFSSDGANNQKGMELHEVNNYGSTTTASNSGPQEVVDTTA